MFIDREEKHIYFIMFTQQEYRSKVKVIRKRFSHVDKSERGETSGPLFFFFSPLALLRKHHRVGKLILLSIT